MTARGRIAAILLLGGCIAVGATSPAWACTFRPIPEDEALRSATVVAFVGGVRTIEEMDGNGTARVTFRVREPIRRAHAGEIVEIWTNKWDGSCGYRFEDGREYKVFAWPGDDAKLWTWAGAPNERFGAAPYVDQVPLVPLVGLGISGGVIALGTMLRRQRQPGRRAQGS